jgi:hypothetical protein
MESLILDRRSSSIPPDQSNLEFGRSFRTCRFNEHNIRFLKEKTHSIRHSLPFKRIPALMLIHMVLYTVQFMNSFPWKGGLKHYPPSAIMTGAKLHMSQLQLKFGSYCQVAEDVTPCNSLAARTHGAIQ